MKRIRLIGFTFMMVCAASAIVAASASALPFEFRAETYPVEWRGPNTNFHRFEIAGAVITCRHTTFNTNEQGAPNLTKESRTLEVHPIYTECRGTLAASSFSVEVKTTG